MRRWILAKIEARGEAVAELRRRRVTKSFVKRPITTVQVIIRRFLSTPHPDFPARAATFGLLEHSDSKVYATLGLRPLFTVRRMVTAIVVVDPGRLPKRRSGLPDFVAPTADTLSHL